MPSKKNTAVITTYGDHEVIRPENKLRSYASDVPADDGEDDPVARAERALAELSGDFGNWMEDECERLDKARSAIVQRGIDESSKMALFHAAQRLRSALH